jgi:WXG100 family type VII secretion target
MSELRVEPAEVHRSGVEIGEVAASVRSAFTNSDTEIASAQSGWKGKSAAALASMVSEWHIATDILATGLVQHGDNFAAAARQYGHVDRAGADSVRGAGEKIGEGG